MDSYQQHQRYNMRPPHPPSLMADPQFPRHQHAPQVPPAPSQGPWYPVQFQYHPPPPPSPPLPGPPPQQQQWGSLPPPPGPPAPYHTEHHPPLAPYPTHPHPSPYPGQAYQYPTTPPPHPQMPLPPPHSQTYSQVNQAWENNNWGHHAGGDNPDKVLNNEESEGRKRAWATAQIALDNQRPQSQYIQMGHPEGQPYMSNHYYHQLPDSQSLDNQQAPVSVSSYQNYPLQGAPYSNLPSGSQQDLAHNLGQYSYTPEGHAAYTAKDVKFGGDISATLAPHEGLRSPSVNQQEVPSSYSSISDGQHHDHTSLPDVVRPTERTHFAYGNHSLLSTVDPRDQPLDFAPRFAHDADLEIRSSYPGSTGGIPPAQAWASPITPAVSYPHDPSSLPGQARVPGPSFQTTTASLSTPLTLGEVSAVSPAMMHVDAFGASMGAERPKKASVPNWLIEEVIKKRDAIVMSAPDPKEDSQSMDDDPADKPVRKGDQADSKNMDSSRSTEEEDDDEDYVEATRTADINQEIKRILTEVLLKVTDELFDEIASKVLLEYDVDHDHRDPDFKASVPASAASTHKASAEVLVPAKAQDKASSVSNKSNSGTPGDLLGLANYASEDEDEDDGEAQSPVAPDTSRGWDRKDTPVTDQNGQSRKDFDKCFVAAAAGHGNTDSSGDPSGHGAAAGELNGRRIDKELSSNGLNHSVTNKIQNNCRKVAVSKEDLSDEVRKKSIKDENQGRDGRRRDKHDTDGKRSSSSKDSDKGTESVKQGEKERVDASTSRRDDRHYKKGRSDDDASSREQYKEYISNHEDKMKKTDYRRASSDRLVKEKKKDTESRGASEKDESSRNRERRTTDEKVDRRHKSGSYSGKRKRRRSRSAEREKNVRDKSLSYSEDSSEGVSLISRRKEHSRKRTSSPSPVRSRRRQVSRSPSSKHTQRRHSPYSSLDSSRGKRSRSRSPTRRQR